MSIDLSLATLLLDSEPAVSFATGLGARCFQYGDVLRGRVRLKPSGPFIVCSTNNALAKGRELVASGLTESEIGVVDLELEFEDLTTQRLSWLLQNYNLVVADRVKPIEDWPQSAAWDPWLTGDAVLDGMFRWRPRTTCIIAGDEGCGKSTFSQILALRLLAGPTLAKTRAKISVCAWEDDRELFRDRVRALGLEGARRVHWFDPDADYERDLDRYLKDIRLLTLADNVWIHVCDPWNAFAHSFDGESETRYIGKMLQEIQKLTSELGITVIIVAHLPKRKDASRSLRVFGLGDVAGSKEFANKADLGICIANSTFITSDLLYAEDAHLKSISAKLTHEDIVKAKQRADRDFLEGSEHMLVAVDKVKVRGWGPRGMGDRCLRAFCYDLVTFALKHDPLASEIAKALWR